MDLSTERWSGMTAGERETTAKQLAKELPSEFRLDSIRSCRLGARQNDVALFRRGNATFALIPSASAMIGYDINRAWEPNADELESWRGNAEEYGIESTVEKFIDDATLRVRHVELFPFLVETVAEELGWEDISIDDPEVREIISEHGRGAQVEVCRGGSSTRVRSGPDGLVIAERSLSLTHTELAAQLRATGFSFPTSDQWEYACGAGSESLFRWGDHVPCNRYPTDVTPAEAAWRKEWVLSAGTLEYPKEGFTSDWDFHLRPNAFGLYIAADLYKYELVAESGLTRGGDGGCTICGGAGFFVGWLALATAYFEEHSCKHDPNEPVAHGYTVGRRVLELR
jgi:hypothetical protein